MKRVLSVLLIALGILLIGLLVSQHPPPPRSAVVYALGDSIETLDPAQMSWHDETQLAIALWEGLVGYHPQTLEPVEGVAYLPPQISADRRVYTFGLRPEARWSNGDPVTAADFVRGWRRAIEPGTAKDYKFFLLDNIQGAMDYYQWRTRAVRTLTILRDLQAGKAVPPADRQWLDDQLDPNDRAEDSWSELAERVRREHLEQMDSHFARVGIEALESHRLRVTLTRPVSYMLSLFAWATFMPAHESVELLRDDDPDLSGLALCSYDSQWTKPDYHRNGYPGLITNGPFYLADWQFKRHLLLRKNPYYWDRDHVPAESIMARIILEKNTAWLSYERGEVDWLDYVSSLDFAPTLIEQARRHLRDDIHVCPSFATYFYNFNCRSQRPDGSPNPFSDWRVRMAFSLAVDKEAIVNNVRKTGVPVARHIIPPGNIAGYSSVPAPAYDPARARRLLAEAGYPDGQGLGTVEILYNSGFDHELPAQAIAEMWRQNLSVTVSLRAKEVKTFAEDRKHQRYVIARGSWFGDYLDPTTFLDLWVTDNGNNDSGFSHPDYDRLMQEAADCPDDRQRLEILGRAEGMLLTEQTPILPLNHYVNILAFRPQLKGLYPNGRDMHPLKYVHLDNR